ncbi:MAG: phosphoglycerate kinase [bacterium]|nr:phosphoglycerate kinase [bacterium]
MLTLAELDAGGRRVLVRSDLNVPLSGGEVADDFRLRATLPTIDLLRRSGAAVVLCSHLGRPGGRTVEALRMAPVAAALSELGGFPVVAAEDPAGPDARRLARRAGPGEVVLVENTRFHPGEITNDPEYAAALADLADLFVLDAFGSAHRAHASTTGVATHLKSAAGPLLVRELEAFGMLMQDPPRPFTVLLGGAKISDKLPLIRALLPKVDALLVGGGMCYSLLAVEGYEVGDSLLESDYLDPLRDLLRGNRGDRLVLPVDVVAADRFRPDATATTVEIAAMEKGLIGLDIGPRTAQLFAEVIAGSGSVFWNGPMGVFEWEPFRPGTAAVATAMAGSDAFTVVGGGDSVAALRLLGREAAVSHLSTGGGAGLELLQGRALPAVEALEAWSS